MTPGLRIVPATERDVPLILGFIRKLADYEKLSHEVIATEEGLRDGLFGARPMAEVLLAYWGDEPAGFALYFHNFSTFVGKPGIYLEDLFVEPAAAAGESGKPSSLKWPASHVSASADASNGRCWIGIVRPSTSIAAWARLPRTSGRSSGSPAMVCAAWAVSRRCRSAANRTAPRSTAAANRSHTSTGPAGTDPCP